MRFFTLDMRACISLITLFFSSFLFSQNAIQETLSSKMTTRQLSSVSLMTDATEYMSTSKYSNALEQQILDNSVFFKVNREAVKTIRQSNMDLLSMSVNLPGFGEVELGMYRDMVFASDISISASDGSEADNTRLTKAAQRMLFYRGVVLDEPNSLVSITITEDQIMGVVSIGGENYNIGKINGMNMHIIYREHDLSLENNFVCDTPDPEFIEIPTAEDGQTDDANRSIQCVRLRVEVDVSLVNGLGGDVAAMNYVAGLFNEVTTLYANDNIGANITEVYLWQGGNPYPGNNTSSMLNGMNHTSTGSDVTTFLTSRGSGGIAWLGSLCSGNATNVCSIDGYFNNVPAYSWDVNVTAHELGHNFNSPHTHACAWNGNNTAIDGCGPTAGYSEGCDAAVPSGGGTVMSYCHLLSVGMDFTLGFGPQPSQRIRTYIDNLGCLGVNCSAVEPSCTDGILNGTEIGIDCGGSCDDCPTCDDGIQNGEESDIDCGGGNCAPCNCSGVPVQLSITFDTYPEEVSWQITNSNNVIVESGGGYNNAAPHSVLNVPLCLASGCYEFTIFDSYGDGICCTYGTGGYQIHDFAGGNIYAEGGQYSDSETMSFCVESAMSNIVSLDLKVILQGPYDSGTGWMRDDLRVNGVIPLVSPYAALDYNVDPVQTTAAMLNVTGANAIVDWVLVSLRSTADPAIVISSKAGLLQRDGDIVSATGAVMELPANGVASAFVVVQHRNHFGLRTSGMYPTSSDIVIDFTNPSIGVIGAEVLTILNGKRMMISGDGNADGQINTIDLNGAWRDQNGDSYDYYIHGADFNLDGAVNTFDKNELWRVNNSKSMELD